MLALSSRVMYPKMRCRISFKAHLLLSCLILRPRDAAALLTWRALMVCRLCARIWPISGKWRRPRNSPYSFIRREMLKASPSALSTCCRIRTGSN